MLRSGFIEQAGGGLPKRRHSRRTPQHGPCPCHQSNEVMKMNRLPLTSGVVLLAALATFIHPAIAGDISANDLAWQIALDKAAFSPGVIDGKWGTKADLAVKAFQQSRGLTVSGKRDDATAAALGVDAAGAVASYTITQADADEIAPLPKGWVDKSKLKKLAYPSLAELVAEKFHCSRSLLSALNGGMDLSALRAGSNLKVPNVSGGAAPQGQRIEISFSQKTVRLLDESGKTLALLHCSIAKDKSKRPSGPARVAVITNNPTYMFNPAKWPEVKGVRQKLLIPPGPRNPVGLCWVGLSIKGYGIHGTPAPEMIGKTGSHGCFRLTNWDATRLGKMAHVGMPVIFKQ